MEEDTIGVPLADNTVEVVQDIPYQDVAEDEMIVHEEVMEEMIEDDAAQYESALVSEFEQNFVYDLYQPLESGAVLICKICLQVGKQFEFEDKTQYTAHRYKYHGSYNNQIYCPFPTCKDVFGSINFLRRHLLHEHKMPIEVHHKVFPNIGEFERWRHIVEQASDCRFMMHAKQPIQKRQIMHCSRSEHKMVLQSRKHRLPSLRMEKEGACCPAFISFRIDTKTGQVHTFYQLYHVGHEHNEETLLEDGCMPIKTEDAMSSRLPALHFPEKPSFLGERSFQYLQVDLIEMPQALYMTTPYYHLLVLTDLHTGFKWAKPIPEIGTRQLLIRIMTDLFCQYGVPEGFACNQTESQSLIRDVMGALAHVFNIEIKEVLNECTDYHLFREILLEQSEIEMKSEMRWVEMVQFVVMNWNQQGDRSPFEKFFKRPPCVIKPPPWLNVELRDHLNHYSEQDEQNFSDNTTRYRVGDHVYLRNVERLRGRGGICSYLCGMVSEVAWDTSPVFPYRVHYSREHDPWPNENNDFIWVTPSDILPTTHDLLAIRDEERQRIVASLMCSCSHDSHETCILFKNHLCSNRMSRLCCQRSGLDCQFHMFVVGDDSYSKMELVSRFFNKDCPESERDQIRRTLRHRYSVSGQPSTFQSENSPAGQDDKSNIEPCTSETSARQVPSILKRRTVARRTKIYEEDISNVVLQGAPPSTSYELATDTSESRLTEEVSNCNRVLNSPNSIDVEVVAMDSHIPSDGQEMFEDDAVEVSQFIEIRDNQIQKDNLPEMFYIQNNSISKDPCSSSQNAPSRKRFSVNNQLETKRARLFSQTELSVAQALSTERIIISSDATETTVKIETEEYEPVIPPRRSGRPTKIKKFDDYVVE